MVRLVADELAKLKRSWVPLVGLALFLLTPLLGVLTQKSNSLADPERVLFDLASIFTQVGFDGAILVSLLVLGTLGIYLVHREYQERTLVALLTRPVSLPRLVAAKVAVVALLGLAGTLVEGLGTVALAASLGAQPLGWSPAVEGFLRLGLANLLVLPCVAFLILLVLWTKNYLMATAAAFGTIVVGLVALALAEASSLVPWVAPLLLSVNAEAWKRLALDPVELPRVAATYFVFTAAVLGGLYAATRRGR